MIFQNVQTAKDVIKNAEEVTDVAWWSINNLWESFIERLPYILAGILVIVIFWMFARIVRYLFTFGAKRTNMDGRLQTLFSRMISAFLVTLGFFTALTIIIPSLDFASVLAGLGFTSVVVGFAAKDILNNFLSGIFILWQRPFQIGDYVFIGDNEGEVEFIGVRATSLRMDDGELIIIPNGEMFANPLVIRGAGTRRRMSFDLVLAFDEDITRAKELAVQKLGLIEGIVEMPKPNVWIMDLTENGPRLKVTFWVDTKSSSVLKVFDQAVVAVMDAFKNDNIGLYPPTAMVIHSDNA